MPNLKDSIFALASAPGRAGVAIIRISSFEQPNPLKELIPRFNKLIESPSKLILSKLISSQTNEVLDECLVVYFRAPKSFTGEHVVEIHCHGSEFIVQSVLKELSLIDGYRLAEPGEFSKRAFLNGKMDLIQAEGLLALVNAHSKHQFEAAKKLTDGILSKKIDTLRVQLLECLSLLSASIDFPDEKETNAIQLQVVTKKNTALKDSLNKLLGSYESGRVRADGYKVILAGPPNVGKSSLLNALLGEQRAIVSDQAGTTRDYINTTMMLGGRLIHLTDMAGIHDDLTKLESDGIELAKKQMLTADLVLNIQISNSKDSFLDLKEVLGTELTHIKNCYSKSDLLASDGQYQSDLSFSVITSGGLDSLVEYIESSFDGALQSVGKGDVFITNYRHKLSLESALTGVKKTLEAIQVGHSEEIISFELQESNRFLSELIGFVDHEEVFTEIFSRFCLGK